MPQIGIPPGHIFESATIAPILEMRDEFNAKAKVETSFKHHNIAAHLKRQAQMLDAIVQALRDEKNKTLNLERELQDLKKNTQPSQKPARGSLINAIARGETLKAKLLIDQGADLNEQDMSNYDRTPLMYAVMQADTQIVSLLIEQGADIYLKDKAGQTALDLAKIYAEPYRAYAHVYAEIVKILEDAAAQKAVVPQKVIAPEMPAITKPAAGDLWKAVAYRDLSKVKSLIDRGADLDESNYNGETALITAVRMGSVQMAGLLIEAGANLEVRDKSGRTALDWAKLYSGRGYNSSAHRAIEQRLTEAKAAAIKKNDPVADIVTEKPGEHLEQAKETPAGSSPAKPQGKPLTVLIDGSGSMGSAPYSYKKAPLERALDSTLALADAGTNVLAVLWGDEKPVPVDIRKDFEMASKGLYCGTEFAPAADYMKAASGSRNFVVLSDGDLSDKEKALPKLREFLSSGPEATLDFVIISDQKGVIIMSDLAKTLKQEYPRQVSLSTMKKNHDVTACLTAIAALRNINPAKKPEAKAKVNAPGLK